MTYISLNKKSCREIRHSILGTIQHEEGECTFYVYSIEGKKMRAYFYNDFTIVRLNKKLADALFATKQGAKFKKFIIR
jgi:hypothetical protein